MLHWVENRWMEFLRSTASNVKVQAITYVPTTDGLTCTGPLADLAKNGGVLQNVAASMSCARDVKDSTFSFGGKPVFAQPATVVLMTEGGPITRTLEAVWAGPPPVPLTIPVGGVIAFSGTMAQADAEVQNGWWICDGRSVSDPASPLNGKLTPNLVDKFIRGSKDPNKTGGADSYAIPAQTIESHTFGFGPPVINQDPRVVVSNAQGWATGSSIHSQGTWSAVTVPTVPIFYSVIYLVHVK